MLILEIQVAVFLSFLSLMHYGDLLIKSVFFFLINGLRDLKLSL
jgi:hypothetical protein